MRRKKIFVTGGNGFLGKYLVKELKKNFIVTAPSSKVCNLLEYKDLKKIKRKFDYIFHLAAWTQGGDFCLKYPGDQWIINEQINTNILKWWKDFNPKAKFIFIGSSCAYAENKKLNEENYLKDEPNNALYTYAMTKRMLLQGAKALQMQYNMKWLCIVPSTLYGPNYHNDNRQLHFIFDLIYKILRGKYYGKDVVLWGNGYQKREIILVKDFVKYSKKVFANQNNKILNIGAGKDYTIREFAKKISNIVGYNHNKIFYDKSRYVGSKNKKLEVNKISKIYPSYKKSLTHIDYGLRDTIEWARKEFFRIK